MGFKIKTINNILINIIINNFNSICIIRDNEVISFFEKELNTAEKITHIINKNNFLEIIDQYKTISNTSNEINPEKLDYNLIEITVNSHDLSYLLKLSNNHLYNKISQNKIDKLCNYRHFICHPIYVQNNLVLKDAEETIKYFSNNINKVSL